MSQEKTKCNSSQTETEVTSQNEEQPGEVIDEFQDEDEHYRESKNDSTNNQNRNEYPSLVAAATRFGIGKLCALTNAMLDDLGN